MILPDTDAPHKHYPHLKAKAAETKHMTAFMVELMALAQDGSAQAKQRLNAAVAIHDFCKLLDESGVAPTSAHATQARDAMQVFLTNYCALNAWAKSKNKMLFICAQIPYGMAHGTAVQVFKRKN
jgi:hypothetical protein